MARRRGIGSHQSANAQSDTWLTPRRILDALGLFDLDPCSAPDPRLWPTAAHHYTFLQQDGLRLPWFGRVWCNPPYGRLLDPYMHRMACHGQGTALIFARTDTEAFFKHVWDRADALLFIEGRLHFHHPDGRPARYNGGAPSVLIAYGQNDVERLSQSKIEGAFVALSQPVMIAIAMNGSADETWADLIRKCAEPGKPFQLIELYDAIAGHRKAAGNAHWKAKVRQTLGRMGAMRIAPAQYDLPMH